MGFTAANLTRLAVVVAELESRGEDLKSVRLGILPILRQISSGKLLPDIVVLYAGQPAYMKNIAKLPIEKQRRIASGEENYKAADGRRHSSNVGTKHNGNVNLFTKTRLDDVEDEAVIEREQQKTVSGIASRGTPKDIAEMAFDLIAKSERPSHTLKHLFMMWINQHTVTGELARQMKFYDPGK